MRTGGNCPEGSRRRDGCEECGGRNAAGLQFPPFRFTPRSWGGDVQAKRRRDGVQGWGKTARRDGEGTASAGNWRGNRPEMTRKYIAKAMTCGARGFTPLSALTLRPKVFPDSQFASAGQNSSRLKSKLPRVSIPAWLRVTRPQSSSGTAWAGDVTPPPS